MGEEAVVMTYRQRPLTVTAIRWEPELGAVHGVRARPKKHKANPDEHYVRDRFSKETLIVPGQWVVTYPDGSNAIVAEGTFQALYEQDVPNPEGHLPPTGPQEAPAGATGTISPETSTGAPEGDRGSAGIVAQNPPPDDY